MCVGCRQHDRDVRRSGSGAARPRACCTPHTCICVQVWPCLYALANAPQPAGSTCRQTAQSQQCQQPARTVKRRATNSMWMAVTHSHTAVGKGPSGVSHSIPTDPYPTDIPAAPRMQENTHTYAGRQAGRQARCTAGRQSLCGSCALVQPRHAVWHAAPGMPGRLHGPASCESGTQCCMGARAPPPTVWMRGRAPSKPCMQPPGGSRGAVYDVHARANTGSQAAPARCAWACAGCSCGTAAWPAARTHAPVSTVKNMDCAHVRLTPYR